MAPGKEYGYIREFNREAYFDLPGMIDPEQYSRDLRGQAINRDTVKYKGQEWFQRARIANQQAAEAEKLDARSIGAQREQYLLQAKLLYNQEQACLVEGTRQITKVTNGITFARNAERISILGSGATALRSGQQKQNGKRN